MSTKMIRRFELWRSVILAGLMAWTVPSSAQPATNQAASPPSSSDTASLNDSIRELREQVRELQAAVADMRSDWQHAHAETVELRRELDQIRTPEVHVGAETQTAAQNGMPQDAKQAEENQKKIDHAASLDEQYQLLAGKVDDQYQTKVESAAKYRLRISGIVLMNAFSNQGVVDSVDLPTLAYARPPGSSGGSFGATLRQSEIGFETFGPDVAGAKTKADLQLDLAGGFPAVPNGVTSGLVRLRTATMRMD
jgi:regulator of replication initiation timing